MVTRTVFVFWSFFRGIFKNQAVTVIMEFVFPFVYFWDNFVSKLAVGFFSLLLHFFGVLVVVVDFIFKLFAALEGVGNIRRGDRQHIDRY